MEARKVPAPWVPTRDIYHVYEATSPVFTPGKPYTDDDYNPCPEFTFNCEDIHKGVIHDDDASDTYDSDSDIDTDSETITSCITSDRDSDIVEIVRIARTRVSEVQRASAVFEVVGAESTIHDASTVTIRADAIHEDTPLKEAWDTTLISTASTKPSSPGPKNWLTAQDLRKLHAMVSSAGSSTTATNVESSISPRSGETVCMTPATPTFDVDVNSRFCTPPRFTIRPPLVSPSPQLPPVLVPQYTTQATDGAGFGFKMKIWISKLWPPKRKRGPRLKRLTILNPS
jgi:hypothetical protein